MASSTQPAGAGAGQKKDDKPADQAAKPETQQKSAALEEDDEFEDFPVDDWDMEETEGGAKNEATTQKHLWEESWDDDDTSDDFSQQLKEELKKVEASKRR